MALSALVKTNLNSFEESLNAQIPQLENQEKLLSLAPKGSTKAASFLGSANIIRSEIKLLQEFIEKIKRFQYGMQTQIQEKLKKAYKTVQSIPLPTDLDALPTYCFATEDTDFKALIDLLE